MRAFVVLGSVSSGTRLLTAMLIDSGCKGSDQHIQPWDVKLPYPYDDPLIVWRRSVPHKDESQPAIRWMLTQLRDRGYETTIIVITREDTDTQEAYSYIYSQIGELAAYEQVASEEVKLNTDEVIEDLFARLDLPVPEG